MNNKLTSSCLFCWHIPIFVNIAKAPLGPYFLFIQEEQLSEESIFNEERAFKEKRLYAIIHLTD